MSVRDRWLLPEGMEEVLPPQAERLEKLRRRLLDVYAGWGYELVMPPFIEYLDSLLTGTGNDLDLQTFKLTDQLTGRLMGLRADMTPQAARIDAHRLQRDVPTRLCYMGTVLHTRPDGFAGSRSPLQVGAELYGYAGVESDAEVLRLMIETLTVTGIGDVHIDLGHVGIFRALVEEAGLDGEAEEQLFDALQRKASAEIAQLLDGLSVSAETRRRMLALVSLNGGAEVLEDAVRELAGAGEKVGGALDELARMAVLVGDGVTLNFDLAELRGYHYHTGVVFAAYVPGHGQAIAVGGRYDNIGACFGKARPATGFSSDLKTLMALAPAAEARITGILAPAADDAGLAAKVSELRAAGERVVCALPGQQGGAKDMDCDRRLVQSDGEWRVEPATS